MQFLSFCKQKIENNEETIHWFLHWGKPLFPEATMQFQKAFWKTDQDENVSFSYKEIVNQKFIIVHTYIHTYFIGLSPQGFSESMLQ